MKQWTYEVEALVPEPTDENPTRRVRQGPIQISVWAGRHDEAETKGQAIARSIWDRPTEVRAILRRVDEAAPTKMVNLGRPGS
jgi:hypothetical protein